MATARLVTNFNIVKRDGTSTITLVINQGIQIARVSLGISILPHQWNAEKSKVINHENAEEYNEFIHAQLKEARDRVFELRKTGRYFTAKQIREGVSVYQAKQEALDDRIRNTKKYTFLDALEELSVDPRKKEGTRRLYVNTIMKVRRYIAQNNINDYSFEAVNYIWLEEFEKWMVEDGLNTNGRAMHLVNIRAAFNHAIKHDKTYRYPFRRFSIKHEKTRHRALPIELLQEMFAFKPKDSRKRLFWDMMKLMFFLRGINVTDLMGLRTSDLLGDRVEYKRAKTGKNYSVKIEPEAMDIIRKYHRKNSPMLLCLEQKFHNPKNFMFHFNTAVKKIGPTYKDLNGKEVVKPFCPTLTSYYMRHSWATTAARLDIPKETISEGLGHEIGSDITAIYIDFDEKKVDEANRKVMDCILYKKR